MLPLANSARERPRELRRRVMLRARMRAMSGWSDACILNVSSRGMMINAPAALAAQGSKIELWHGDRVIVATVVWRKGTRAGVRAEERIPVEEILANGQSPAFQLTAVGWPQVERRKKARDVNESHALGRALEFAGVAAIAVLLAAGGLLVVEDAFAKPLHYVRTALSE